MINQTRNFMTIKTVSDLSRGVHYWTHDSTIESRKQLIMSFLIGSFISFISLYSVASMASF